MSDWADERAAELLADGGFIYESPAPKVAQALRDVRAAERARCVAIVRHEGHRYVDEIGYIGGLTMIVRAIESGETP